MSTPLEFFNYKNGSLCADGVSLSSVADLTGTPVYVYSSKALLSPLRQLQDGLKDLDHTICFAVKSNSNIAVLKLLADSGAGMDLVSGGELYRAGLAGVRGDQIVFSGVGKTPGEIVAALEYRGTGIYSFNVESLSELEMINAVSRELKKTAPIALRFNPDVDAKTHPYISTGLKKNKFGLNRAEILKIAKQIKNSPDHYSGLALRGISIHIGSQLLSLSPLADAFKRVCTLVDELDTILPSPLQFIDLGGGIGITYKNEKTPPLDTYCELILKTFGKMFGPTGSSKHKKRLLLEPGRSIAGNAGVLLTETLHRKVRSTKDFLIVDAAMNDLLRPSLYGSYHEIVPVEKAKTASKGKTKTTDVVGPVCETGDCFASDRKMSTRLGQGDLLAILSTGAYGFTMSGNYNSRPRPAEVLLIDGQAHIIRPRESYEDLTRGECFVQKDKNRRSKPQANLNQKNLN